MDYSSRGRPFKKASNAASPESHRADVNKRDDEESRGGAAREVIVKIEAPSNPNVKTNTTTPTGSTSSSGGEEANTNLVPKLRVERDSGEFSFHRPGDDDGILRSELESPSPEDSRLSQQDDVQRRSQRLPPLHPDNLTRQSPELSPYNTSNYRSPISLQHNQSPNTNVDGSARDVRVSFKKRSRELKRRPSLYSTVEDDESSSSSGEEDNYEDDATSRVSHGGGGGNNPSGEILRNRSHSGPIKRIPTLVKLKSRILDPPTPLDQRSGNMNKSSTFMTRSGLLKPAAEEEEEDPFFADDLPEEFKRTQISTFIILEWASLISILGALICTLIIPILKTKYFWKMNLWKWEVLILVLICGRLVSGWAIRILVFFIERNFLLRKRVLYFVYGLKKSVQIVIWFGLVLLTWSFLFDKRVEREAHSQPLKVITKLLIIGEACALLWLLKTLVVKVCASSFHVNAYFDRIQEAIFNQFVIETLSGQPSFELQMLPDEDPMSPISEVQMLQNAGINVPPDLRATAFSAGNLEGGTPIRSPIGYSARYSGPFPKKLGESQSGPASKKQDDQGITIDDLQKMNQRNVSAWNMKKLMRIVRKGALMTTLDEQAVVDAASLEDEHTRQIVSEVEAKAAARTIFRNVAKPHSKHIYMDDLRRFMREDEVIKTMSLFEGAAETQRISKRSLRDWVVKAFRDRRSLSLTLCDTKTAVNKLHKMVNVVVAVIIVIILALALKIISSQSIVFLCSQLVLVAFVFGNTCKNVFESLIFLFVIHPFDVGDRCEIDGIQMVVEEMNILTTVFLRYDNLKVIFPNFILLSKPINNFYRSPDMGDAVEFSCPVATPPEKIALMKDRILSYIKNKHEHWYNPPMIILKDIESFHTITMAVWLRHKINHQDMGLRFVRRALLVEECIKILKELDMEYRVYPVSVNITSMPSWPHLPFPSSPSPSPSPSPRPPTSPFAAERSKDVLHS